MTVADLRSIGLVVRFAVGTVERPPSLLDLSAELVNQLRVPMGNVVEKPTDFRTDDGEFVDSGSVVKPAALLFRDEQLLGFQRAQVKRSSVAKEMERSPGR